MREPLFLSGHSESDNYKVKRAGFDELSVPATRIDSKVM